MKIRFQRNTALKFIAKQPPKQKERMMSAIGRLPEGDVVPVENMPGFFSVYHAGNRGDVYKNLS
ncbi:MAG: hypothetical protein LBB75_08760 [Oscillospiraceae bacterium]|nr:hypothetical protein [Oscillospiraceae bacterium]